MRPRPSAPDGAARARLVRLRRARCCPFRPVACRRSVRRRVRPARRRGGRSAPGRASTRRNRARSRGRNGSRPGSPPCSPQMPSLMSGPRRAAALGGDAHHLADPVGVERHERVVLENAGLLIGADEARRVVARDAVGGLRQIVGAEAEELGALGDLAGEQRGARQFDHRADRDTATVTPAFSIDLAGRPGRPSPSGCRIRAGVAISGIMISGSTASPVSFITATAASKIATRLHLVDLGIGDAEPAAAMAEHRVGFVQRVAALPHRRRRSCRSAAPSRRIRPRSSAGTRAAADRAAGSSPAGRA